MKRYIDTNNCSFARQLLDKGRDYKDAINYAASKNTFILLDPPYKGTEGYYQKSGFGDNEHAKLFEFMNGIFGGFAPNSSSAETLSKALGSRTVMTGSVSRSKNDPSQSLQMIERPLLTPDELKSLPKGDFIVMKTGVHPMRVHLKLFFKWGIEFDKEHPYTVLEHGNRKVEYAEKKEIQDGIMKKYHPKEYAELKEAEEAVANGGQDQIESELHEPMPEHEKQSDKEKRKTSGSGLKPQRRNRTFQEASAEVQSDAQS